MLFRSEVCSPFGSRVRVIIADVLAGKHTINPAVVDALADRPFKLIANLPYNVASPLLVNLASGHRQMTALGSHVQQRTTVPVVCVEACAAAHQSLRGVGVVLLDGSEQGRFT